MFGFGKGRGRAVRGADDGRDGRADRGGEARDWFRGDPLVELDGIDFSYAEPYGDDGAEGGILSAGTDIPDAGVVSAMSVGPAVAGTVAGDANSPGVEGRLTARPAASSGAEGRGRMAEPGRHPVLQGFSMTIRRGECVALLGPNGSGKTTIMRIINALEFPDAGTYRLGGTMVERDAVERRNSRFAKALHQRVGFVFQNSDTQLFCPSVEEEIAFGPLQMGLPEEEVARRVRDLAGLFGLERMLHRAPYRLSGGEKKRVAIACCMSLNPDLLVLDEPTDGLDERNLDAVVAVLRAFMDSGKTVLISTHHHDVVEALGARVVHVAPLG